MTNYKIFWTDTAQSDLLEIIEYIKKDSLVQARKIFSKIKNESIKLKTFPNIGRNIPEFERYNLANYRELVVDVWRLVYTSKDDNIYILCVVDSRRNLDQLLFKKLLQS